MNFKKNNLASEKLKNHDEDEGIATDLSSDWPIDITLKNVVPTFPCNPSPKDWSGLDFVAGSAVYKQMIAGSLMFVAVNMFKLLD